MSEANSQKPASINPLERGADDLLTQDSVGYWTTIWRDVRTHRIAVVALTILGVLGFLAILGPILSNHRPYIAQTVDADGNTITTFPLFRGLDLTDLALLGGGLFTVWASVWSKILARHEGKAAWWSVAIFVLVALATVPWGLAVVPWERPESLPAAWWWALFGAMGALGLIIAARGGLKLVSGERDVFGRDMSGPGLRRLWLGSVLLMVTGAVFANLGVPKLDTTDYYKEFVIEAEDGTWAMFPPVPHDYKELSTYTRNQPPGGPYLDVIGSGSDAAADLNLGLNFADKNIADQVLTSPLTPDTSLSDLRGGEGIRQHTRNRPDFTIITGDLSRTKVSLYGAETLQDAIDAINEAGTNRKGVLLVEASFDPQKGILLHDKSKKRPRHWLGTDASGSDVAARIVIATRVAVSIGFVSTGLAVMIGITFGSILGYFGGKIDAIGMRIIEIFMAIPRFFLLITIIAFTPAEWNEYRLYFMMVVIGCTSWMGSARFIRAEFFKLREMDYIQAARACGLPLRSVLFKHMLPNGITPVLVAAAFGVAAAIFLETGLSFLGFGIQPPEPSWGQMLSDAVNRSTGVFYWWLAIFPGIMIFFTVFSLNLVGDVLRDAIDPRLKKAQAV